MKPLSSRPARLTGHVVIGLLYVLLLLAAYRADPGIAAENRLMENLQAASLFLALAFSLVNLAPLRRQPPAYVTVGMTVFFLTLFLREIEPEGFDLPAVLSALGSGTGKNLLLGLLWAGVLFSGAQNRQRLQQDAMAILRSPLVYYLLAAAVFYLLGEALDKKLLPLDRGQRIFWEEAAECLAALWCAMGTAVWTLANIRRQPDDSHVNKRAN